ncbi:Ribonuclease H domain [Dillenia turbinata]|uniref:Ribonuclease H domain n=1 Tax=Dillenia turbinata TaxID=194707 RepID=A0AAN8W3R5_9MAGN
MRSNQASVGGIFRNSYEDLVHGFWINIGIASTNLAELWSLREGLAIARKRDLKNIEVETNSLFLVNAINKGLDVYHPLEYIVQECRSYMKSLNVSLTELGELVRMDKEGVERTRLTGSRPI